MKQERKRKQKQKGAFQVKRIFEPDRMAPVNLQVAYEQVVSSERYRIISLEQRGESVEEALETVEEVML
jgi:hypothetical protein